MKIGVVLPHFSDGCTWDRLIGFAPEIERLGYASVWARDHLSYSPGPVDPPGSRFLEPCVTLAAVAARTSSLEVGFTVLIPLRHPLIATQLLGSLSWVAQGRLMVGIGIGGPTKQFEVLGIPYRDRIGLCEETAQVIKLASSGSAFSFHGRFVDAEDVVINPAVPDGTPMWYGGCSPAALRRAAKFCDGIMPFRTPFRVFDPAADELRRLGEASGKQMLLGMVALLSIDREHDVAVAKVSEPLSTLMQPLRDEGMEPTLGDVAGAVVVGNSDDCVEQMAAYASRGIDHVVLDCRSRMADYEGMLRQFAEEVLPRI